MNTKFIITMTMISGKQKIVKATSYTFDGAITEAAQVRRFNDDDNDRIISLAIDKNHDASSGDNQ